MADYCKHDNESSGPLQDGGIGLIELHQNSADKAGWFSSNALDLYLGCAQFGS